MGLPVKALPTETLTIEGQTIEVRGLSRTEALRFTLGYREEAMPDKTLDERAEAAEVYVIATGTGISEAEVVEWRNATDPATVGQVVDAVIELSGLTDTNGKDADPK